jgi:hypothetical protein
MRVYRGSPADPYPGTIRLKNREVGMHNRKSRKRLPFELLEKASTFNDCLFTSL